MRKLSVIVPVYNVEAYIEECIQSVLNQTYDCFEIILIDDGSSDHSGSICDWFALENPERIVVMHNINQGPLPSRMDGIQKATGDILVFLDSDDCIREDALEIIANSFEKWECDMLFFDTGDSPNYPSIRVSYALEANTVYQADSKRILYENLILQQMPNSVCLKAVKKECVQLETQFSQFSHVKHGEDLLMSACFMTNCEKIVYIKEGLYHYRARPGSAVHSFNLERKESIKIVHTELEKCIDNWNMPELKPLHNARKVKGWIDTLLILLENSNALSKKSLREQIKSMAEDSYFRTAYAKMDNSQLSYKYRLLAFLLLRERYFLLYMLRNAVKMIKRPKTGR